MIVVTVDLDSANGEKYDKNLFTMIIINDGSGTSSLGNYDVLLGRRGTSSLYKVFTNPIRKGRVQSYKRKNTHVGKLVKLALESVHL